jgi:hypothetical protein
MLVIGDHLQIAPVSLFLSNELTRRAFASDDTGPELQALTISPEF